MNAIIVTIVLLVKKPIDANDYALTWKIEANFKVPKFKIGDRVRTTKYQNIFSKGYPKKWSKAKFMINSVLKTNPWTYTIKDLNGWKIIGSFHKK